jgi:hypothetical protein
MLVCVLMELVSTAAFLDDNNCLFYFVLLNKK